MSRELKAFFAARGTEGFPCGLSRTRESVLEHAEIFYKGGKTWGAPETLSLPSPILPQTMIPPGVNVAEADTATDGRASMRAFQWMSWARNALMAASKSG